MKILKQLLEKLACKHNWYEQQRFNNMANSIDHKIPSKIKIIYICKKCGKFKKIET